MWGGEKKKKEGYEYQERSKTLVRQSRDGEKLKFSWHNSFMLQREVLSWLTKAKETNSQEIIYFDIQEECK